jgi:hypothetical protein
MTPVFDPGGNLVAWFDGQHFFDLHQNWIAFAANGHIFSANSNAWLGPLQDGSLLDINGRPVAWLQGATPTGTLKPMKPLKPLKPFKPLRPLRPLNPLKPLHPLQPLGGWSQMQFAQWVAQ